MSIAAPLYTLGKQLWRHDNSIAQFLTPRAHLRDALDSARTQYISTVITRMYATVTIVGILGALHMTTARSGHAEGAARIIKRTRYQQSLAVFSAA